MAEYIRINNVESELVDHLVSKNNTWTVDFKFNYKSNTSKFRLVVSCLESDDPFDKNVASYIIRQSISISSNHAAMMPTKARFLWDMGTYTTEVYRID